MMFVVVSYDVREKRVKKVHDIVQKYLLPVHRSVFQGYLTEKQLGRLRRELAPILQPEEDNVVFYKSFDIRMLEIEQLGIQTNEEMIL